MKKLIYLIVLMLILGLVISGCSLLGVAPVEQGKAVSTTWHVPKDFATIQEAIDSSDVQVGDKIIVGPGNHAGAIVNKAVEIKGEKGAVINSGPLPWLSRTFMAGFLFPGDDVGNGTIISSLLFEIV